ncbi:glycoside hydrolase family 172 protein [Fulvitalea axinellae]
MRNLLFSLLVLLASAPAFAQKFNSLETNLHNLYRVSDAKSRSITPENRTGDKGKGAMTPAKEGTAAHAARDLGDGWKTNPYINIQPGQTEVLAEIEGPGAIKHIWMTPTGQRRFSIIRIYWDDEKEPSVEAPVGDFFANGWGRFAQVSSAPVTVNPGSAYNCYWVMPFRRKCKITMTNIDTRAMRLYYQVDYELTEVPEDAAYFHAQFRRVNPLPYKEVYTILDGIKGKGHYVGTYMCWGVNNNGWWGEGEVKFYLDGDKKYPTICGTGTEDYFCGSYNFEVKDDDKPHGYREFTTPYAGMPQVIRPDGLYNANMRFGLYRWHIIDPVRFEKDLKVTVQALGWRSGGRYLPLQDDISSVAFWYQLEPHKKFPKLPSKDYLEVR